VEGDLEGKLDVGESEGDAVGRTEGRKVGRLLEGVTVG